MNIIHPFFSDAAERAFTAQKSKPQRLRLGQIFTPYAIAQFMTKWVSARKSPIKVLDPALGLGIFLRCMLEDEVNTGSELIGYEIDPEVLCEARKLFTDHGYTQMHFMEEDYLKADWEEQFDAIVCNPPYRKFRGLPEKDFLVNSVKQHTGLTISKAANYYIFFLIKIIWQLAKEGRAAVILPFEFLNADYGVPVKQALLDQGILRKIVILGKAMQPFTGVVTTACIVCLERSNQTKMPEIILVETMEELSAIADGITQEENRGGELAETSSVFQSASEKWRVPVIHSSHNRNERLVPLATFGKVMRGIATGDNGFFMITEAQRLKFNLEQSCVVRCLAKSSFAPGNVFSNADFSNLVESQRPVWLLDLQGQEELEAVQRYIQHGLTRGTDQRYLTRKRSPWYALEKRPPAPLLVTTFSRGQVRWVRNLAAVRNLTSFHGFYPSEGVDLDLLCAYLVTPMAQRLLSLNRREYGNGLHKYEPNDLNQALVVDIRAFGEVERTEVLALYDAYVGGGNYEVFVPLEEIFRRFFER